jgi:hypothetical protein
MRIWSENEPREWNIYTIRESTTRSEDSVRTVRADAQYDTTRYEPLAIQYNRPTYSKPRTVWYDMIQTASDRPTMQYIHVRPTLHSTDDLRFVLYFIGEYSTVRYEPRAMQFNTYGKPRTVRYDMIRYDTARTASDGPTIQYIYTCMANPAQYIRSAVRTVFLRGVLYGTIRYEPQECWLFTICEIFLYAPMFFMIRSVVRISSVRNRIVL